jgi:DNA adenine methylase
MGFGSAAVCGEISGFRANSNRSGTTPAHDWHNFPDKLPQLIDRLRGVVIENKDAHALMMQHDSAETLHYADPPYVHDTRRRGNKYCKKGYKFEMDDAQHRATSVVLRALKGTVIVSGYACDLYDKELFPDWVRIEKNAYADGARNRVEVLWMNREPPQARMFG